MRILFIKPKHIGDSLILTPAIVAVKKAHPEAEIWVLVRRKCEGILAGCPEIDRILTIAPVYKSERNTCDFWHDLFLATRLWLTPFDYVFELGDGHRGRLFAMLCRAKRIYSVKTTSPLKPLERFQFTASSTYDWQTCHRVEKDYYSVSEFLPLPQPIPPLRFDRALTQVWEPGRALLDFVVMQVGTRQGYNCWSREGWREVCRGLLERHENVVVACGPVAHEAELAESIQKELGPRVICTRGEASWPQVADLLYRARLYVGLNTATMHLAAACGCPCVSLFGPTIEDFWYPWQVPCRIVTSHGYKPLPDIQRRYEQCKRRSMQEIHAKDVIDACDELLANLPSK
ncbi:MAG: glycosyltransferase family 9 protein [Methylacidiphilales bacterium]|nr:glycosyltransferase family 9 protein [Candidatus Methylacidiphilales bacterium]